jgi:hypothetical protein
VFWYATSLTEFAAEWTYLHVVSLSQKLPEMSSMTCCQAQKAAVIWTLQVVPLLDAVSEVEVNLPHIFDLESN